MALSVKLEVFEGPLDLLLHLIEKNKVNIYDIPIVLITEQYMEYIHQMQKLDLNLMSEFLVMAATLLNIKSKMLLPREEKEDEEEEDPRQELVERLLQYKMYKYMSYELKDKQMDASRYMFKEATIPKEIKDFKEDVDVHELLGDLTLSKLHHVFESVMKKQVEKIDPIRSKFKHIEQEEVNLTDKIDYIKAYGELHKQFSFRGLLEQQSSKMQIIVTFMGMLELMKMGFLTIVQDGTFADILITYHKKSLKEENQDLVLE